MIKPLIAVTFAIATLSGCANNNTLSGDTFSSSQAGQAQTVTYGTLVSVRPVTIQGGDGNNVAGAIGGAVVGGFWVIPLAVVLVAVSVPPQARLPVALWGNKSRV